MMKIALLVVVLFLALTAFPLARSANELLPESSFIVKFDNTSITITAPNGEKHSVAWKALTKVGIRTTDDGPYQPDVFWGLHTNGNAPAVVFPGGATGETALMKAMHSRLPGFNDAKVIEAMGSTSNAYFLIWEAVPRPAPHK